MSDHHSAPVPSSTVGCPSSWHRSSDVNTGPSGWTLAPPPPGVKLSCYTLTPVRWCLGPRCHLHALVAPQPPPCPSLGTAQLGKKHLWFEHSAFWVAGTRRSPSPALLTRLFAMSLAQRQQGSHSHSSCAVARSCISAYKGGGGKGKDLSVLCPQSRVPIDQLEGPCPYLWTASAVHSSSCSTVRVGDEPDHLPWMHTTVSTCPERREWRFHLTLGTGSHFHLAPAHGGLGDYRCWHASTGKGTARESCSTRPASPASSLTSRPGPWLVLSSLCALLH